jgi:hypothetical protein
MPKKGHGDAPAPWPYSVRAAFNANKDNRNKKSPMQAILNSLASGILHCVHMNIQTTLEAEFHQLAKQKDFPDLPRIA